MTETATSQSSLNVVRVGYMMVLIMKEMQIAGQGREGVGVLGNDYQDAFDYMLLLWVFQVMINFVFEQSESMKLSFEQSVAARGCERIII